MSIVTKIESVSNNIGSKALLRVIRILPVVGLAALVLLPAPAVAQSTTACGPDVKEEVARVIASVENAPESQKESVLNELYAKYYPICAQDAKDVPQSFFDAARECGAAVSNLGSLFYEEMSCSGYDPQRRQFATPIKIKQVFGFGAAPLP